MNKPGRLQDTDRRELCHRADFPAMLAADGVEVTRKGAYYTCKLRADENTASCTVYPPGVGRRGADGWTFHDYGGDGGGDALAYLMTARGLAYPDAVRELIHLADYTPAGWEDAGGDRPRPGPTATRLAPARKAPPAGMDEDEQAAAVLALLLALDAADPSAVKAGDAYLQSRGVLPAGWPSGDAWNLTREAARKVARDLADGPDRERCREAGLLVMDEGKPPRLAWWGPCVLLVCRDGRETRESWPAYLVARCLDYKPGGQVKKYLNQNCQGGATRWGFGWPSVYAAARLLPRWPWKPTRPGCLLVEGSTDAAGAWCLGWAAVAVLNQPQAAGWDDEAGGCARMLEPHLAALRDVAPVAVVPDADPGEKGIIGQARAACLVAWLKARGIRADVRTLADLYPVESTACKDLADVAWIRKALTEKKAPPPAVKSDQNNGQRPQTVRGRERVTQ